MDHACPTLHCARSLQPAHLLFLFDVVMVRVLLVLAMQLARVQHSSAAGPRVSLQVQHGAVKMELAVLNVCDLMAARCGNLITAPTVSVLLMHHRVVQLLLDQALCMIQRSSLHAILMAILQRPCSPLPRRKSSNCFVDCSRCRLAMNRTSQTRC